MGNFNVNPKTPLNPPLRIFTDSNADGEFSLAGASPFFSRPKLARFVNRERVAKHLTKRRFSLGAPLD